MKVRVPKLRTSRLSDYRYKLSIRSYGWRDSWRGCMACLLRRWAARLDGCESWAVYVRTSPRIERRVWIEIVREGFMFVGAQLIYELRNAAVDRAIEESLPAGSCNEKARPE